MIRIISGDLKGRKLITPKGQRTHPMGDRVRSGLFNALGDIKDLMVLDAFGGSGALSVEALSRGASSALIIEIDAQAQAVIEKNILVLGLRGIAKLVKANCSTWSDRNPEQTFDLVFAAPPYDDLQEGTLQKLVRHVKPGGLYILDWPGGKKLPELDGLNFIKELQFGDACIGFYRKAAIQ